MAKLTYRIRMTVLILFLTAAIIAVIAALFSAPYLTQTPSAPVPSPIPDENRLVICTSHKEEVWWPVIKEFEERTGIYVEVIEGGSNELLERLEAGTQEPACDVMFGGGEESLYYYRDLFRPYRPAGSENIDSRYLSSEDLWTPFSALPIVLIYNPKLVREGELTSFRDLLDKRYKGRIAFADPTVSASSFTGLATLISACGGESEQDEILKAFALNLDRHLLASSGDVLTQVASGTCLVGICLEETALKRIAAGDSLAIVYPEDGTSAVPDGSAVLKNAPHPENAERFLDYTVSEDVQNLLVTRFFRRSVCKNIPEDSSLPALRDIPMLEYDLTDIDRRRSGIMTGFAFFFGGEDAQ